MLLLVLLYAVAWGGSAQARQGSLDMRISKSLQGDTTVALGELLEFRIVVENTGVLSITNLVVVDEFEESIVDPASVGQFAEPGDPPLSEPPGTFEAPNRIVWSNLLDDLPGGVLGPGESIELTVRLRAIRPTEQLQLVNRARVEEAVRDDGEDVSGAEDGAGMEAEGGAAPVEKGLLAPQPITAGELVTFTIRVANEGAVPIENVPLSDNFSPAALDFVRAVPPPSSIDQAAGQLTWDDLLALTGRDRLEPGEAIVVTTVYRALQTVDGEAVNEAEISGARDRYGNELEASQSEVPIQIIGPSIPSTATSTASATPEPTLTPAATATATPATVATTTATPFPTVPDGGGGGGGGDDDDDDDDDREEEEAATRQAATTTAAAATATSALGATAQATISPVATAATAATAAGLAQTQATTATMTATATATSTPEAPRMLPETGRSTWGERTALVPGIVLLLLGGVLLGRQLWARVRR
jgi:uncharacterized repeat protein (TIGR01451 family)